MLTEERRHRERELCAECKGACCKTVVFPTQYSEFNSFAKDLYETRGWFIQVYKGKLWIYKEESCPELTDTGCKIFESRPAACKMYDGRNDPILRTVCLWNKLGKEEKHEETT